MTRAPGRLRTTATMSVLVVAACLGLAEVGSSRSVEHSPPHAPEAGTEPDREPVESEPREPAEEVAEPVRIWIPSIDVDAGVVRVGLQNDGAMETPDLGRAGWYTEGPKPGEEGPSVVIAHVDSKAGPDVFYRLRELRPGAEIHIERSDGSTATWVSERSEQTDKDELPVESIWNPTDEPVLRLVTCGGAFDRSVGHYTDNVIVYADPRF